MFRTTSREETGDLADPDRIVPRNDAGVGGDGAGIRVAKSPAETNPAT